MQNSKPLNAALHLPNGRTTPITHIGDVFLTSSIVLSEVLCVPSFHCNLVSISKLTADSSASIIFFKHSCLLQDLSLKQMVEIGRVDGGLYARTVSSTFPHSMLSNQCTRVHTEPSLEAKIWHARLGHPAAVILNKLSVIPSVTSSLFTTCDVCLRLKQQRLTFSHTESSKSILFDLIHYDLWGLINIVLMTNAIISLLLLKIFPSVLGFI